jgi:hypothetical protein
MYNSCMIDIETLSNTSRSVVVTIGVCEFNPDNGTIGEGKCIYVNPQDAQNKGAEISAGTVMWWMGQSREAQQALISTHAITLKGALQQLTEFIVEAREKVPGGNLAIYANDPNFDLTILENSYHLCGLSAPWAFWEHRSCRTMAMLGKRYGFNIKTDFPREGTAHNALDDAIYQAGYVNKIMAILDARMGVSAA